MVVVSTYGKVLEIVNNKPQLQERRKTHFISYTHSLVLRRLHFSLKYLKSKSNIYTAVTNHKSRTIQNYLETNGLKQKLCKKLKMTKWIIIQTTNTDKNSFWCLRDALGNPQIDYNCHEQPLLFYLWSFLHSHVRPKKAVALDIVSFEKFLSLHKIAAFRAVLS